MGGETGRLRGYGIWLSTGAALEQTVNSRARHPAGQEKKPAIGARNAADRENNKAGRYTNEDARGNIPDDGEKNPADREKYSAGQENTSAIGARNAAGRENNKDGRVTNENGREKIPDDGDKNPDVEETNPDGQARNVDGRENIPDGCGLK